MVKWLEYDLIAAFVLVVSVAAVVSLVLSI
jgi:hypothetical protein